MRHAPLLFAGLEVRYTGLVGYEKLVESQIEDAIARGVFNNLPGQGRPLELDESTRFLAGENWLGYKILRDNSLLPEWLEIARDIERQERELERIDAEHAEAVARAASLSDWEGAAPAIEFSLRRYESAARRLRASQDQFNVKAPGIRSERPAIWVEQQLERLRRRAHEAGMPETEPA